MEAQTKKEIAARQEESLGVITEALNSLLVQRWMPNISPCTVHVFEVSLITGLEENFIKEMIPAVIAGYREKGWSVHYTKPMITFE